MQSHVDRELAVESTCRQMAPAWVQSMRDAAMKVITQADVEEIVRNQLSAAKKGDKNAIRFLFEQVLGGGMKGATFVQNNYGAEFGDEHARPTPLRPGSAEKIEMMGRRFRNGQGVCQPGDATVPGWECAGCGHAVKIKPEKCPKCGKFSFKPLGPSSEESDEE